MQERKLPSRRTFLKSSLLGAATIMIPFSLKGVEMPDSRNITFGICTDVHKDIQPDAEERLRIFVDRMKQTNVDFVIQLGDFCFPKEENKKFMRIWNDYPGTKYHVLGNHDMDISSKRVAMDFWGMQDPFYSFDAGRFHFIVLDPNFIKRGEEYLPYDTGNFYNHGDARTYVPPQQIEWLREELESTDKPVIIFSHQSLAHGCKNDEEVRTILEATNKTAGYQKVIACLNGHHHSDRYDIINGIHYVNINSMSYQWLGSKYRFERYPPEVIEKYPSANLIASYRDPLYALVTLGAKKVKIKGIKSRFIAPTPEDLGVPVNAGRERVPPKVSNRVIKPS